MSWTPPGPAWLFCPADRPERYAKAAARADVVILDLEDGVALPDKAAARQALFDNPLDPAKTVVRINSTDTTEQALDLAALGKTAYPTIMLAKCEGAEQVRSLSPREVIALIESPRGAIAVAEIAHAANTIGLMWGAEDLVAGLGGNASRGPDGLYRHVAQTVRSNTLLAAKAHGRFALDSVYIAIKDLAGLRSECADAVAVGFDVKVAIHPTQVDVIREAYTPTDAELDWARRVVAAAETERGVFAFDGKMVDAPVLRHAEQIVRRSGK